MSHQPRKRFGQNFLRDAGVIAAIVDAIHPQAGQHLVEIGPGQGALTRELLPRCRRLDVLEIDRDLVAQLQRSLGTEPKLHIHSADALRFPLCSLIDHGASAVPVHISPRTMIDFPHPSPLPEGEGDKDAAIFTALENDAGLRVIGNLPYNISTPLLFRLFEQSACIEDMYFMLQKEVVDRLVAVPGDDAYGRLSVMAQYYAQAESLFDVYPDSFYPPPKVVSSVFRLVPHRSPPVDLHVPENLGRVVAKAFSQRRKTLRNALKGLLDDAAIVAAGIDPGARAETLSLQDYARLANSLV